MPQDRHDQAGMRKAAFLGELIPGLTHELNNPVGYVNTNLSMMVDYSRSLRDYMNRCRELLTTLDTEEGLSGPAKTAIASLRSFEDEIDLPFILSDTEALLDESREGVAQLQTLIGNLQTVSGPVDGEKVAVDLNQCLQTALIVGRNEFKYKTTIHSDYGELSQVNGHAAQLSFLFLLLLTLAARSIEKTGNIHVVTKTENDAVLAEIADDGTIASFDSDRITAARAIVDDHGGRMDINRNSEQGTLYRLIFPAVETA